MSITCIVLLLGVLAGETRPAESRDLKKIGGAPITVYRDPGRYVSFPDVKQLPGGAIFCVFRDASYPERVKHIESDARIVGCLSQDGGKTWLKPFIVYDDPTCQQDPSVSVLRDGRLVINFFNWVGLTAQQATTAPHARRVDRGDWGEFAEPGNVFVLWGTSVFNWERQVVPVAGRRGKLRATSSSIRELKDGTLLLPVYGSSTMKRLDAAYVLRSTDHGRNWTETLAAQDLKVTFQEPALVEARNGDVIAVMRTDHADDHLYAVRSADGGVTWDRPQRLEIIGHPADLLRLPDGSILLTYGYRHPPFGVRACISRDDGHTWDIQREFLITDAGAQGDLGYPSVCMADDDHVVVAYYMNGRDTKERWIECKRISLEELR